jgi:hypothetical protein
LVVGEHVDLDREALVRRLQLTDKEGHVLVGLRMRSEIRNHVLAEGANVGEPPEVDLGVGRFVGVRRLDLFPFCAEVVL